MTAPSTAFDLGAGFSAPLPAERRLALPPAEGWSSVVLLALMAGLVGWAIDDAHWVLGPQSATDFLPWAGVGGVLAGLAGAAIGRGRLVAHGLGAVAATLGLVWAVGGQIAPGQDLGGAFAAVAERVWAAYYELVIQGREVTDETAHFLLVLGVLVWGTGQFAAYAVLAHHRPLAALLVPGMVLVVNIAITARDQFALLVLFAIAGLLLLVRSRVAEEERIWTRHRIADAGGAITLAYRAGLVFVAVALAGSLGLTAVASSAPLAGAWQGLDQRLIDFGRELARLFPAAGPTRLGGGTFGSTVSVTGLWNPDETPVLAITSDPLAPRLKWRAATFDRLTDNQWSRSSTVEVPVEAGQALLAGTAEAGQPGFASREVEYHVRGLAGGPGDLVTPGLPLAVDHDARLALTARAGGSWLGAIRLERAWSYTATAAVPILDPAVAGALTENRLRAAGSDFPPDLLAVYTDLQPGTAGSDVRALLGTVLAASRPTNAYDAARAIESYLRSDAFTYDTDVLDVDCGERGVADCFAMSRRGYCEHFATTMVVMLRLQGIPSRFVVGYLSGERDAAGTEVIRRSMAHAWVEVWFPGLGWVDFDPTGGGVGQPQQIPAGPPVATPPPFGGGPLAPTPRPEGRGDVVEPDEDAAAPAPLPGRPRGIGPLIVLLIPAVGLLVGLGILWLRRRRGRPVQPEIVYRAVASLAGRLGHPRRPTQTVYEYLGYLSDAVPAARPDLQLVAQATVEATYGRRRASPELLAARGEAQRRLRVGLLGRVLRRRRPSSVALRRPAERR
jgi:transglutaminase-like putative cysteine protease